MQDFRYVSVWQRSHQLTLAIYKATADFPKHELFGLVSQMRRSSASIPTNIAEGCGRGSDADFGRFLQMAMGSACELDYQLLLAKDLGYFAEFVFSPLSQKIIAIKRMATALLKKVKSFG